MQHVASITIGNLPYVVQVDPLVLNSVSHAPDDLLALHGLGHDNDLVRPVPRLGGPELPIPSGGVLDDPGGVQLVASLGQPGRDGVDPLGHGLRHQEHAVRAAQVQHARHDQVQARQRQVAQRARPPVEERYLAQHPRLLVARHVVPAAEEVRVHGGGGDRRVGGRHAPLGACLARQRGRGGGAEEQGVEQVDRSDGRGGVQQVGGGVVGVAEGAVEDRVRAVLEVEQLGGARLELVVQDVVPRRQGPQRRQAREDQVAGRGRVRARHGEDVLGRQERQRADGEEGCCHGEEDDGDQRARGQRPDGLLRVALGGARRVEPGNGPRNEHGPEEDDKGLDPGECVSLPFAGKSICSIEERCLDSYLLTSPMISPWLLLLLLNERCVVEKGSTGVHDGHLELYPSGQGRQWAGVRLPILTARGSVKWR